MIYFRYLIIIIITIIICNIYCRPLLSKARIYLIVLIIVKKNTNCAYIITVISYYYCSYTLKHIKSANTSPFLFFCLLSLSSAFQR